MRIHWKALATAGALILSTLHAPALAQEKWPAKPVSLVVPFPPGGTSDVLARQLAAQLGEVLGSSVIVENKAGASTAIGAQYVARAPKDGYTLLLSSSSTFTITPHLIEKLPYRLEDFAPIAPVAVAPFAFVVKKDFPARTVADYVSYAKAHPGAINNATNGQGSLVHLFGELIASGLGVQMTQVHYKGASPATMDMIGGIVDSNVEAITTALPNIQAGRYRALAVLSSERLPLLPDVPTFRELGYPGIVGETWYAVSTPAGTPRPVIDKLNDALRKVTTSQRFGDAMHRIGNEPKSGTPEELLQATLQQSRNWAELIKREKIRIE